MVAALISVTAPFMTQQCQWSFHCGQCAKLSPVDTDRDTVPRSWKLITETPSMLNARKRVLYPFCCSTEEGGAGRVRDFPLRDAWAVS